MNWTLQPLLRPLFAWLLGILLALNTSFTPEIYLYTGVSLFIAARWFERSASNRLIPASANGLLLYLLFTAAGAGMYRYHHDESLKWEPSVREGRENTYLVTLTEKLPSQRQVRFRATVDDMQHLHHLEKEPFPDILLTFSKNDSLAATYSLYDQLLIQGVVQDIDQPSNPFAFDYKEYLHFQGISATIKPGLHCHEKKNAAQGPDILLLANKINKTLVRILDKSVHPSAEKAVAIALLTGDDALIHDALYKAYAITGAVHVLSVSGMHVAIFIGPFIWLFGLVPRSRTNLRSMKLPVLFSLIGFYCFVTGLSPSVVRSGIMIAIVLLASQSDKKSHPIQGLSLTALLMLCYNPFYIHQVSFLFSFISLAGILVFEKKMTNWWTPANWLARQIWKLSTVSIAAQLLIIPWSLYYFHQISCTFLVSGWVAVPVVTLIMYYGSAILFLKTMFVAFPQISFDVLAWSIRMLNTFIVRLSEVPYAALEGIYINRGMLVASILLQLCWISWLKLRSWSLWNLMGMLIFTLQVTYLLDTARKRHTQGLVVYDVYSETGIDMYLGSQWMHWPTEKTQAATLTRAAEGFRLQQGLSKERGNPGKPGIYCIANRIVCIPDSVYLDLNKQRQHPIDIFIDTGQTGLSPTQLYMQFQPEIVVLCGGVDKKQKKSWIRLQAANSFNLHDVNKKGAFILEKTEIPLL